MLRALDLFCCAGGASRGLALAGFHVTGVDIEEQPEYPIGPDFTFRLGNALACSVDYLRQFDLIWASPPCQRFTAYKRRPGHVADALNLIPETRALLRLVGVPYIIENVVGAPLENPTMLCGSMFGLDVQRHRLFECSFPIATPPRCDHSVWKPRFPGATNRAPNSRKTVEVGVWRIPLETQQAAMGGPGGALGLSLEKLSQAIPPAYSEWLAKQAIAAVPALARKAA